MASSFKKDQSEIRSFNQYRYVINDRKKVLQEEYVSLSIYCISKANNKYMKDYGKNNELSYIPYWDVNNVCGGTMSQKLPVNNFG